MRVNIIGCAPGGEDAPYDSKRWGINDNHTSIDQIDVVIDCHNLKRVLKGKEKLGRRTIDDIKKHLKLVKKTGILMYSTTTWKNMPNIKRYPLEEIVRKFDSDYFGSGPDFAIALAVYQGYREIHLYGILMIVGDEYMLQRSSLEHWIGIAKGAGVKVVHHDPSRLSSILRRPNGKLYGYNTKQKWLIEEEAMG